MEVVLVWLVLAVLVGVFASSRGRSGFGFFLIATLLSPLIGFIIVLVTKDLAKEAAEREWQRRKQEQRDFDQKREHERQLESLRALAGRQQDAPAPVSAADEIAKLGELVAKGLLTDGEFAAQKAAILRRSGAVGG